MALLDFTDPTTVRDQWDTLDPSQYDAAYDEIEAWKRAQAEARGYGKKGGGEGNTTQPVTNPHDPNPNDSYNPGGFDYGFDIVRVGDGYQVGNADPTDVPPTPGDGDEFTGIVPGDGYTTKAQSASVDEDNLSGIAIGNTDPVTRTVQDNELVSSHLENLLSGDSSFIRNARQRAAELANRRGQFTSNLFAGSAERAATEAAMPIAQNDAQAYRDAATQNLQARNQNAIANIQRAAQLDSALLSSRTSIAVANLDAATRVSIANADRLANIDIANLDAATRLKVTNMTNATQILLQSMQADLEKELQTRNMHHDQEMEKFKQQGRIDLANLDIQARIKIQEALFAHEAGMQADRLAQELYIRDLNAEDQMKLNMILQEYENERQARDHSFNARQSHINMAMQAQINYINYLSSFAGTEMDSEAAAALQLQADNQLEATFEMINLLYPDQPAIKPEFGTGAWEEGEDNTENQENKEKPDDNKQTTQPVDTSDDTGTQVGTDITGGGTGNGVADGIGDGGDGRTGGGSTPGNKKGKVRY